MIKLVIEIKGTEHTLTKKEARHLYKELGEVVGETEVVINPAPIVVPRFPYDYPRVTWVGDMCSGQIKQGDESFGCGGTDP